MRLTQRLFFFFLLSFFQNAIAQPIPAERTVDWTAAGLTEAKPDPAVELDVTLQGIVPENMLDNDLRLNNLIGNWEGGQLVLFFPPGTYYFRGTVRLKDQIILKGASSESTIFQFQNNDGGDLFDISGTLSGQTTSLLADALRGKINLEVADVSFFQEGDYLELTQNGQALATSSWAMSSVGQILKIVAIEGNQLIVNQALRKYFLLSENPIVKKMIPVQDVGIECLKIERLDLTENQTSNISFQYAANCWVSGVESANCNFAHLAISNSTNILVEGSFFHDAFDYGNGGKAYGVALQFTSGECLIENNVFDHLRHSVLLQAGSNGNVVAYNYSTNPFWTGVNLPTNSAGDLVLHGNYPFANLFEGNICQNIVLDDSHGINGPFNTFFRNRAESFGIFMANTQPSDSQNFVGNVVSNSAFPLAIGLFILAGTDQFSFGNYMNNSVLPSGTESLVDSSLYLRAPPGFLLPNQSLSLIGLPNGVNTAFNPAKERFVNSSAKTNCGGEALTAVNELTKVFNPKIFPNPIAEEPLFFEISEEFFTQTGLEVAIYNVGGILVFKSKLKASKESLDVSDLPKGVYFLQFRRDGQILANRKLVRE